MKYLIHLYYPLGATGSNRPATWSEVNLNYGTEIFRVSIDLLKPWHVVKAVRHFKPSKWRLSITCTWFVSEFLWWLGRQNDYLYPPTGSNATGYPFKKAHLWRTRFGFRTSWEMAKLLTGN